MTVPNTRRGRGLVVALTVALALVATGCTESAQSALDPVGETAIKADKLWNLVFWIAVVIFFVVEAALVFALVKFRRRPGREASQFHGNTKLEIVLTVIPALILAAIAVPTMATLFDIAEEPPGAMRIQVVGRQFWWEYSYEGLDIVTANELHIPTGREVLLVMQGDEADVIHAYWPPRLSGKHDLVPGRISYLRLRTDEPGTYRGQCAEFCGLSHANMRLRVIAQPQDEFDQWVEDQQQPAESPGDSLAAQGERLFLEGTCVNCHAIEGTDAAGISGPNLTHFASRETFAGATFETNEQNLARWLDDPPSMKPGAKMPDYGLSQEDIDALVAYLMSLE